MRTLVGISETFAGSIVLKLRQTTALVYLPVQIFGTSIFITANIYMLLLRGCEKNRIEEILPSRPGDRIEQQLYCSLSDNIRVHKQIRIRV